MLLRAAVTSGRVANSGCIDLIGIVEITLDIRRLTIIDRSTSSATVSTTTLTVIYSSSVGLASIVAISGDDDVLSAVDDCSGVICMSGKGETECSNAETDDEDRFEVHG